MLKKLTFFALVFLCFSCDKKQQDSVGCPANQACTLNFAMVGVQFKDKNGTSVAVQNLTAINQRTNVSVLPTQPQGPGEVGYYYIADDSMRSKFSTEGDEVIISAKYAATGQTKTAVLKISGGCNCHVTRISGPQVIVFD